jgi:hypothetical protein
VIAVFTLPMLDGIGVFFEVQLRNAVFENPGLKPVLDMQRPRYSVFLALRYRVLQSGEAGGRLDSLGLAHNSEAPLFSGACCGVDHSAEISLQSEYLFFSPAKHGVAFARSGSPDNGFCWIVPAVMGFARSCS